MVRQTFDSERLTALRAGETNLVNEQPSVKRCRAACLYPYADTPLSALHCTAVRELSKLPEGCLCESVNIHMSVLVLISRTGTLQRHSIHT